MGEPDDSRIGSWFNFSVGNCHLKSKFKPINEFRTENEPRLVFGSVQDYHFFITNSNLTDDEKLLSEVDPRFAKFNKEEAKLVQTLIIPQSKMVKKNDDMIPKLYAHRCVVCGNLLALEYDKKRHTFKFGNAKKHLKTHQNRNAEYINELTQQYSAPQSSDPEIIQCSNNKTKENVTQLNFPNQLTDVANAKLLEDLKMLFVRCVVMMRLPRRSIQNKAWHELFQGITHLNTNSWPASVSEIEAQTLYEKLYGAFVSHVTSRVKSVRLYLAEQLNLNIQPFLCIMHDGWVNNRSGTGISMSFVNPKTMETERISLGMLQPPSYVSYAPAEYLHRYLKLFSINRSDIAEVVSDTAAPAALAASRCLPSKDSAQKCGMHIANLIVKHSLGLGRIYFREGEDTVTSMSNLVSAISSTVAKKQFFLESSKDLNARALKSYADTRMCSAHSVAESLLKNMYCVERFKKKYTPSKRESTKYNESIKATNASFWTIVAEFEALLRPVAKYAKLMQTDKVPLLGFSILLKARLRFELQKTQFEVVDVNQSARVWHGNTRYADLPKKTVHVAGSSVFDTLHPESLQLRKNLINQFNHYFCKEQYTGNYWLNPSKGELLGMALDPLVKSLARSFLEKPFLGEEMPNLWRKAMSELDAIYTLHKKTNKSPSTSSETSSDTSKAKDASTDLLEAGYSKQSENYGNSSSEVELKSWTELDIGESTWLQICPELSASTKYWKITTTGAKILDYYSVCTKLSGLSLFKNISNRSSFPIIHRLAMIYLATPVSNSFQERVFCKTKYIDAPNRNFQSVANFHIEAALSTNEELMSQIHDNDILSKLVQDEEVRKFNANVKLFSKKCIASYSPTAIEIRPNSKIVEDADHATDPGTYNTEEEIVAPPHLENSSCIIDMHDDEALETLAPVNRKRGRPRKKVSCKKARK